MPSTAKTHVRKFIGTSFVIGAIFALMVMLSGQARSLLLFIGNDLSFTGVVTQVNPTSFQVDKGGTYPFTIVVDGSTAYSGGFTSLADIDLGENIMVDARENQGTLLAEEVSPVVSGSYGYGTGCEPFQGSELWVSAIESDFLWLSRANVTFTVQYDANTRVHPGSQSIQDLEVGETIAISGDDCQGDGVYASDIVRNNVPPTEVTACEDLGGYVIGINQVLLSHDVWSAYSDPVDMGVPAGMYDVYGVSFDNHSGDPWGGDTQEREQWFVKGFNDGAHVYTSGTTDDIPNDVDSNVTMIGSAVYVSELDAVQFVHAAYQDPLYHSVWPECIAFVPIEVVNDYTIVDVDDVVEVEVLPEEL